MRGVAVSEPRARGNEVDDGAIARRAVRQPAVPRAVVEDDRRACRREDRNPPPASASVNELSFRASWTRPNEISLSGQKGV